MSEQEPDYSEPTSERQAELLAAYEENERAGREPYQGVKIRTRGELTWIIKKHKWTVTTDIAGLDWATARGKPRERANLSGANFSFANLQGIKLRAANLVGAFFIGCNLSGADFTDANLAGARLRRANLSNARFAYANLLGARLRRASGVNADFFSANLAGTHLQFTNLSGANLRGTRLDSETVMTQDTTIDDSTRLSDVTWNNAQLTAVKWPAQLGDEHDMKMVSRRERIIALRKAARGYRGLSLALRQQGILKRASDYRLREQRLERHARLLEGHILAWFGLGVLDLLAGYGERLGRIFIAYAVIVLMFAAAFLVSAVISGQATLALPHALDALQISLNAVHGRVFFAQFHLDTLQSWLATAESIVGIVIEGVFVAMLIQRFFAR